MLEHQQKMFVFQRTINQQLGDIDVCDQKATQCLSFLVKFYFLHLKLFTTKSTFNLVARNETQLQMHASFYLNSSSSTLPQMSRSKWPDSRAHSIHVLVLYNVFYDWAAATNDRSLKKITCIWTSISPLIHQQTMNILHCQSGYNKHIYIHKLWSMSLNFYI